MRLSTALLSLVAVLGLAPLSAADRIYLIDGSSIDCNIVAETLKTVSYQVDGKSTTVATEQVLQIEYERKPQAVDEADIAATDGNVEDAIAIMEEYIAEFVGGKSPRRGQEWAPAYAMSRVIELARSIGDSETVVEAAQRLIKNAPESRQLPEAYLAKACAELRLGKAEASRATLTTFRTLIDERSLSERWLLECRLGSIRADTALKPAGLRTELQNLQAAAGEEYPTVTNRARVYEAQALLAGDAPDYGAARAIFARVVDDPKADAETLAAAYVGLGDCTFQAAAALLKEGQDASEELRAALLSYLRVVVVYPDEIDYHPKALFYAGRCYNLLERQDENASERAQKLFRNLMRDYPESTWAEEAKAFA